MSATPFSFPKAEQLSAAHKTTAYGICGAGLVLGAIGSAIGFHLDPAQFTTSWLWAFYCYFPLVSGALFWVLLHYICDSNWSVVPRRIWENLAASSWMLFLVFVIIALSGAGHIWKWFNPEDQHKMAYLCKNNWLNPSWFYFRALLYFGFIAGVALWYRRHSTWQDHTGSPVHWYRMRNACYFLMVTWAILQTGASIDWLMSLDFAWSSSLFGVYSFALSVQGSLAAGIVLLGLWRKQGYLLFLNAEHFQLMGKLLFGFTILWAYFAFGQYLLIWYANIPEETIFYNDHNRGSWQAVTWLIIVGKFIFPVTFLLAQETKRNFTFLWAISLWIVLMHFVEMFWLIQPYRHETGVAVNWQDLAGWLTVTSLLGLVFIWNTSRATLFPINDPRLRDCLKITN